MSSKLQTGIAYVRANKMKLLKYCGVAAIAVPVGLFVYGVFLWGTDLSAPWANFVATLIMVPPNYFMNRYWVWKKNDANRFWGEVVPFSVIALIGLLVSTVTAAIAGRMGAPNLVLLVVNFMSFGIVWVAKFFVLDRFLFVVRPAQA